MEIVRLRQPFRATPPAAAWARRRGARRPCSATWTPVWRHFWGKGWPLRPVPERVFDDHAARLATQETSSPTQELGQTTQETIDHYPRIRANYPKNQPRPGHAVSELLATVGDLQECERARYHRVRVVNEFPGSTSRTLASVRAVQADGPWYGEGAASLAAVPPPLRLRLPHVRPFRYVVRHAPRAAAPPPSRSRSGRPRGRTRSEYPDREPSALPRGPGSHGLSDR